MSRKINNLVGSTGYGDGNVISSGTQDYIVGRVLQIIETIGLQKQQEDAVKNLIRESIWREFESSVYILPDLHTVIREAKFAIRKQADIDGTPSMGVSLKDIK